MLKRAMSIEEIGVLTVGPLLLVVGVLVLDQAIGKNSNENSPYFAGEWHALDCSSHTPCSFDLKDPLFGGATLVVDNKQVVPIDIRKIDKNRYGVLSDREEWDNMIFSVESDSLTWETGPLAGSYIRQE